MNSGGEIGSVNNLFICYDAGSSFLIFVNFCCLLYFNIVEIHFLFLSEKQQIFSVHYPGFILKFHTMANVMLIFKATLSLLLTVTDTESSECSMTYALLKIHDEIKLGSLFAS